jgi:hypothetical protein
MLSAFAFIGVRKNIRYRCIDRDGVNVLSHEYRVLARNEKSSQGKDVTIQIPPAMKEEVASI